jgi:ABC-type amino acid transport substrate-binding protein
MNTQPPHTFVQTLSTVAITVLDAAAVVVLLTGCGVQIPADPDGTLRAVTNATIHAGGSPHADFLHVDNGEVTGSEAEAVEAFAESIGADVEWTIGSEEELVRRLENGSLDVVVAGLTDQTPWADQAGMTRPYAEVRLEDGEMHALVMLVPVGENQFLTELETFLASYTGETQ